MDDIDKLDAALNRLESEQARRLAEKVEAGEIVSVPLFVVAGSEAVARAQVEGAKAEKLAELRAAGETREVAFTVKLIVTGVCKHGEATGEPWKPTPRLPTRPRGKDEQDQHSVDNRPDVDNTDELPPPDH